MPADQLITEINNCANVYVAPIRLAMRGAFECRTGMRTTSNEVKQWTAEDVESYLDDAAAALGITCLLEPMKALGGQLRPPPGIVLPT